jgi:hypothetical protein
MRKPISIFFIAWFLFATDLVHAQSSGWRVYSHDDNTFSVEVPKVDIELVRPKDPKRKDTLLEDGVTGSLMRISGQEDIKFTVLRLDWNSIPDFEKMSKQISEEELVGYFAVMYTGDDDESQLLSEPTSIHNGGNKGREYSYVKTDKLGNSGGNLYTRSRLFVVDRQLFIIRFDGTNEGDLRSKDADRFLTSFKIFSRAVSPR